MIRTGLAIASVLCWGVCAAAVSFDFGADLRIRQEIYDNAPCLPGGPGAANGLLNDPGEKSGGYVNRIRFRPRVWGEAKVGEKLRVYTRLADEFRWNITPHSRSSVFPDEIFLDNLFVEAEGLLDGFLDFKVGRQDIDKLYGLDHLFQDGTASDGSRSLYADMAAFTLNFEDERKLDVFAIYQHDNNHLRWGNGLSENRSLTGTGLSGAESERDEWGGGAVWSAKFAEGLDYQIFAMHKNTASYRAKTVKRPSTRRELLGAKLMPRLTDEWSLQFEGMGQIGEDGEGETLYGWSSYAAAMWKSAGASRIKPFASAALHFMSGDKDSAETGGGWDLRCGRGRSATAKSTASAPTTPNAGGATCSMRGSRAASISAGATISPFPPGRCSPPTTTAWAVATAATRGFSARRATAFRCVWPIAARANASRCSAICTPSFSIPATIFRPTVPAGSCAGRWNSNSDYGRIKSFTLWRL